MVTVPLIAKQKPPPNLAARTAQDKSVEPYSLLYAGARDPKKHGVGKTDIYNFTGAEPYGAPTAVYRYKG